MAGKRIAIIDNSVLAYAMKLSGIDLLKEIKNIFQIVLIPQEVKKEFEPSINSPEKSQRNKFLDNILIDSGFYRLCVTYDPVVFASVSQSNQIDGGEAEIIAQAAKRSVYVILADDKKCMKYINQNFSHFRVYSTLDLIVFLDIHKLITNYEKIIFNLKKIRPFKSIDLRMSYERISKEIGISLPKKMLSEKTSLKRMKKEFRQI